MNVEYDFYVGTFFRCQTVNIWLMTLFLFAMTFYMKMTQETTRTRWIDSSRTDIPKISLFSHCTTIGLLRDTVVGRESFRHATGLLQFNRIGMTWWHQVYLLTTLLPSAHRDLRDLCYIRLKQNQTAGGSDEALGKPELTHGRVFDFFSIHSKSFF